MNAFNFFFGFSPSFSFSLAIERVESGFSLLTRLDWAYSGLGHDRRISIRFSSQPSQRMLRTWDMRWDREMIITPITISPLKSLEYCLMVKIPFFIPLRSNFQSVYYTIICIFSPDGQRINDKQLMNLTFPSSHARDILIRSSGTTLPVSKPSSWHLELMVW